MRTRQDEKESMEMKMYEVDNTGELFEAREDAVETLVRRQTDGAAKLIEELVRYVDEHGAEDMDLRIGFNYICDCMDHCEAMCEYNRQDMEASLVDDYIIETEVDE